MAENNQLSDETKNNSTDTSSTDASSAVIGNHENAVVPHKISNHDKLVQTMVMVDGEWINVNDTNDQANMKEDMHKVNKKVVEAQKGIVEAKNAADSAVKYADSAVSASKVNSDALVAQSSAISEAKAAADDAASKAQFIKENASSEAAAIRNQVADVANNVSSVKADVASATSDVANLKVDVQANSAAIIKTNEAVSIQSKSSSDAINELKIANGQVESIAKDAKNNATVAKQTADAATIVAQDAKSNAVVAKQTASSATIEATNATSTASKAELSVNGLTTRVDGIEGDTKKLSGRVTSTETILQQTKDQLLQKADKSVVDQANNLIGQLSAEQKTMAGQISQKVSSAEYQTLRDKVNGIQVGTSNLLHHSDTFEGWYKGASVSISNEKYLNGSVAILNNSGSGVNSLNADLDGPYDNQPISWAVYAKADNAGDKLHTELWGGGGFTDQALSTEWKTYKFTGQRDARNHFLYLWGCRGNKGKVYVALPFAVVGNYIGTWLANPTDTITSIQKNTTAIDENSKAIKLKADQTEVDNVKNTASYNSSRLDVMNNEIKSKVSSTDVNNIVDSKGYATQNTVQSLIDQKAGKINESITSLTNTVNNNGGGVNLVKGTSESEISGKAYDIKDYYFSEPLEPNTKYTISIDAKVDQEALNHQQFIFVDPYTANWSWGDQMSCVPANLEYQHYKYTFITPDASQKVTKISVYLARPDGATNGDRDNLSGTGCFKKLKVEKGEVATPYSQAPSDDATVTQLQSVTASIDGLQSAVKNKVDQSQYTQLAGVVQTKVSQSDFNRLDNQVNVQTLDNANIDNMKTTGHYFVHNLTGNPLGGWVYVDVTGNGNDRIRQDVYQDNGTKHAFRRWFNTLWTEWSTGAEESEITQLRNDINLRVKSGDLLSQINIAAGHTLIQSNKIYFDADSFVMSPNSKAFIPSAYITNINADKITTGTLDAAKFNVKNLSADSITSGTLDGIKFKTEFTNDNGISIMGDRIAWTSMTSFGEQLNGWIENSTQEIDWLSFRDLRLQSVNNIAVDTKGTDDVTRWSIADYDYYDQPGLMSSNTHKFIPEEHRYDESPDADQSNVILLASANTYVAVRRRTGIAAHLDSKFFNEDSTFSIQKEDKVGFYVGQGRNGNQINVQFAGDDSGFNVHGNFNVYGAKNSAVKTSQGDVAVSAYETAEYYFGDIGEGQTDSNGVAYVGIEKLFNETVNTNIPYQVFITAYGSGNIWVEQRKQDRFMVKSSQPNIKFGWEIKAKRRGYENTRLQKVN